MKKAIFVVVIAIPIIVGFTYLFRHFNSNTNSNDTEPTYGTIDDSEFGDKVDTDTYDQEIHEDSDYWDESWESDIAIEDDGINLYYKNIDDSEFGDKVDTDTYDQEIHEDSDYWDESWESDIAIEDDGINLYYKNMETIFNYLPIGVVKTLRQETSEFLIRNGYSDETSVTILTNTIIGDRNEVVFQCTVDSYPVKTLRQETSEFLIRNGYSDETSVTILTNTIIGDRNEVVFQCTVDSYPDMIISIHYKPRIGIVDFNFENSGKS